MVSSLTLATIIVRAILVGRGTCLHHKLRLTHRSLKNQPFMVNNNKHPLWGPSSSNRIKLLQCLANSSNKAGQCFKRQLSKLCQFLVNRSKCNKILTECNQLGLFSASQWHHRIPLSIQCKGQLLFSLCKTWYLVPQGNQLQFFSKQLTQLTKMPILLFSKEQHRMECNNQVSRSPCLARQLLRIKQLNHFLVKKSQDRHQMVAIKDN